MEFPRRASARALRPASRVRERTRNGIVRALAWAAGKTHHRKCIGRGAKSNSAGMVQLGPGGSVSAAGAALSPAHASARVDRRRQKFLSTTVPELEVNHA